MVNIRSLFDVCDIKDVFSFCRFCNVSKHTEREMGRSVAISKSLYYY